VSFLSLIFALYYGINGIAAAAIGASAIISLVVKGEVLVFLSLHYVEACFLVVGVVLTGIARTAIEQKITRTSLANAVMQQRMDRLLIELSEKDRGLQDVLEQVLTEVESPRILYQAIRRIGIIEEHETFLNEILHILYTYCHVEKSAFYKPDMKVGIKRVASFGATSLPENMKWKSEEMPEIMRVLMQEREIIIPKKIDQRLIMAVIYILLIEEIRFINMSEKLIGLLKLTAFWTRYLLEKRLYREKLQHLSAFTSVTVYQPSVARKVLDETISSHEKHKLPFVLLRIKGIMSEADMRKISSGLRIYDDMFMLNEEEILIFLSMTDESSLPFIIDRLKVVAPQLEIKATDKTGH
ncbi:MAG: hypothetical protein JRJ25_00570, partial [Deltaproteobacteria bacterium]|nr:hypothetical protein [Deltaproteobacteria bacterium]